MNDPSQRSLARLQEARMRANSPTRSHISLTPHAMVDLYVGVIRDVVELSKLRMTESGDREAIRANYDLRVKELQSEMLLIESAICKDHEAFDALRSDNKEIINKLLEMGEVDAAIKLQQRFLEVFGGSTLERLVQGKGVGSVLGSKVKK